MQTASQSSIPIICRAVTQANPKALTLSLTHPYSACALCSYSNTSEGGPKELGTAATEFMVQIWNFDFAHLILWPTTSYSSVYIAL